jgi:glutamate 5-kinase
MARDFSGVKRVVVKVGTSSLTNRNSRLEPLKVRKVVREVMDLRRSGKEVLLVTSGAIGAGVGKMEMSAGPRSSPCCRPRPRWGRGS